MRRVCVSIPLWFDSNKQLATLTTDAIESFQFHFGSIQTVVLDKANRHE